MGEGRAYRVELLPEARTLTRRKRGNQRRQGSDGGMVLSCLSCMITSVNESQTSTESAILTCNYVCHVFHKENYPVMKHLHCGPL